MENALISCSYFLIKKINYLSKNNFVYSFKRTFFANFSNTACDRSCTQTPLRLEYMLEGCKGDTNGRNNETEYSDE